MAYGNRHKEICTTQSNWKQTISDLMLYIWAVGSTLSNITINRFVFKKQATTKFA